MSGDICCTCNSFSLSAWFGADWYCTGIPCAAYHAGLPAKERAQVLSDWAAGRTPVVAATFAFGMGIDRACVRLVVHADMPKTLEGFYQVRYGFVVCLMTFGLHAPRSTFVVPSYDGNHG